MDWNDVRLIVEIGRTHSFTGAAVILGLSKATVSRRVAALEQMAGTRLFRRTPQGAMLTPEGEKMVARAARIESEMLDLEHSLRSLNKAEVRLVSVRMSEGVASYLITPAMAGQSLGPLGCAARREGIHLPPIRILPADAPEGDITLSWLPKGKLPKGKQYDKIKKLVDVKFVPFYSDLYQSPLMIPEKFSDLSHHSLVTLESYNWFSDPGWMEWHSVLKAAPSPISAAWSCSVGHFTLRGAGIGVLPTYSPMYADGMHRLDLAAPPMQASLWIVTDGDAVTDPVVRTCHDSLIALFSRAEWMG